MDVCSYCRSSQKSHFWKNFNSTARKKASKKDLNTFTSRYQKSLSKRDFCEYHESSSRFCDQCLEKDRKVWPTDTEINSFEDVEDRSRDAFSNSRINGSSIVKKEPPKPTKIYAIKSVRGRKINDSTYTNVHSNCASNEEPERNVYCRIYPKERYTRTEMLNEESGVGGNLANQRPLNKFHPSRNTNAKITAHSYHRALSKRRGREERYTCSKCRNPLRRSKLSVLLNLNSRPYRSAVPSASLSESTCDLASQKLYSCPFPRENKKAPTLQVSNVITKASVDPSYRRTRESREHKHGKDPRPGKQNILGERGSSCRRESSLLRGSGKLCKVARTRESKRRLGCYRESARQDEAKCFRCCYCSENVNGLNRHNYERRRCEGARRPFETKTIKESGRTEGRKVPYKTFCKSLRSRINDTEATEMSREANSSDENFMYDDICDDGRANNSSDKFEVSEVSGSRLSLSGDWSYRACRSIEVARECKKMNNDFENSRRSATRVPRVGALREKIVRRCRSDKELLVSEDSSRLERDIAESACERKALFRDTPVTCQTDFCARIKNGEKAAEGVTDSLDNRVSTCCCCTSSRLHDETDPVKILKSFCEKVKAINKSATFRKPSRCASRKTTGIEGSRYPCDERSQSEISIRMTTKITKPLERDWSADSIRLRFRKLKCHHGETNLDRILIYPSREGERGTLDKKSSTIDCRVKRHTDSGFRYNVTYVRRFTRPARVSLQETSEECDSLVDCG